MDKYAVFHIEGGIGKHVAATAVIEAYKNSKPDRHIVIVCAWPEVFLNNPNVHRLFRVGMTPNFYKDFIYQKDVEVFVQEPYKTTNHITKKTHLIESWCDLVGIQSNGEGPKININYREREIAFNIVEPNKSDKPILLFQPFGGPGGQQENPFSWMRDIHPGIAQRLVNILNQKYNVLHVCYEHHPVLENCKRFDKNISKKVLFGMLLFSNARLLIDSSLQHAAAALGLPSTVVWVATQPNVFGYGLHQNITPNIVFPEGTVDSYLYDYNFTGSIHECPYSNIEEIYDIDKILASFMS